MLFGLVGLVWWWCWGIRLVVSRICLVGERWCCGVAEKYWTAEDLRAAGFGGGAGADGVYSITDASAPQSEGVSARAVSYAVKMALRVVFIVAGVLASGVWQWVFFVAAAVIPWFAVVVANGTDRQHSAGFSAFLPEEQVLAIEAAQAERVAREQGESAGESGDDGEVDVNDEVGPVIIEGEIVVDDVTEPGKGVL